MVGVFLRGVAQKYDACWTRSRAWAGGVTNEGKVGSCNCMVKCILIKGVRVAIVGVAAEGTRSGRGTVGASA